MQFSHGDAISTGREYPPVRKQHRGGYGHFTFGNLQIGDQLHFRDGFGPAGNRLIRRKSDY